MAPTTRSVASRATADVISIHDPVFKLGALGLCALAFPAVQRSSVDVLCLLGFATALFAERLSPKTSARDHAVHGRIGLSIYLTVHTNLLNLLYFALRLAAPSVGSPALEAATRHVWPVAFALGCQLTPLYYGLDHFNPAKVRFDREKVERGFRWVPLANHLCHAPATPLTLLHASTLDARHAVGAPAALAALLLYDACYVTLTLVNTSLTGTWTYPIIDDAEAIGGKGGVALFFGAIMGLLLGLGMVGRHVVAAS